MSVHLSAQVEPFSSVIEEAKPLLARHWEDLALDKDVIKLAPDWRRYATLENEGALSVVTLRAQGKLVGYACHVVMPELHYSATLSARMDIFWIAPEFRGRAGGLRLFRAVEAELRRRGVGRWYVGSKLHKDVSRLFLSLGFTPIETWFSKLLRED